VSAPQTPAEVLQTLRDDWKTAAPAERREIEQQARAEKLLDSIFGGGRR